MQVFLENLELLAYHGVYDEERREGRRFRFDVAAEVDSWTISDDPGEILDYRKLARIVLDVVVEGPSRNLIETLGWDIADATFSQHPEVLRVDLTIRKYATGVVGDPEWVGMRATLARAEWVHRVEST